MILDEIGRTYGTDKSTLDHGYCDTYERLFEQHRDEPVNLLELGVYKGASLLMWAEYFTHRDTHIFGVDLNECHIDDPRVSTIQADQAAKPPIKYSLDIVIDDASHISSKTIASFQVWFPQLKPGGLYIVEDLATSYYLGGPTESNNDPDGHVFNRYHQSSVQFLRRLADEAIGGCQPRYRLGYDLEWVTFRRNMAICKKRSL